MIDSKLMTPKGQKDVSYMPSDYVMIENAGMSGGSPYLYDPTGVFPPRCNKESALYNR